MKQEIKIVFFGMLTMSLFSSYHMRRHQSMPFVLDNNNNNNNNNNIELLTASTRRSVAFYDDENDVGIVSKKDPSFFHVLREEMDGLNDRARCERYGFGYDYDYDERQQPRRRIFFGALVASEPWELFEIVAAEAHGLYDGIVLVESNRTQNFSPRKVTRANNNSGNGNGNGTDTKTKTEKTVANLFGVDVDRVQLRFWTNEDGDFTHLTREKQQRDDVLKGWQELGMRPDDIAVLGDIDETFTRDFLIALRTCGSVPELDYEHHRCLPGKMGLRALTQIYESSPECIWSNRKWFHPSMFSGHCIEGIGGGDGKHKSPPRETGNIKRSKGWSNADWNKSNPYTPLANGGDFRIPGAKKQAQVVDHKEQKKHFQRHTAYHFHNFFVRSDSIRFKYFTYGHADKNTYNKSLTELHNDIAMMVHCVKNMTTVRGKKLTRVEVGFEELDPFTPVYFRDASYRSRRHQHVLKMILRDEEKFKYWKKRKKERKKYERQKMKKKQQRNKNKGR